MPIYSSGNNSIISIGTVTTGTPAAVTNVGTPEAAILNFTIPSGANGTNGTNGTGTVNSVALTLPAIFTVTGSPVTTTGTLAASLASQTANTAFLAPDGSNGTPGFRALVAADIPSLAASKITSGVFSIARLATGTPDGTKFVRDDGTLAVPSAGGGVITERKSSTFSPAIGYSYLVSTASGAISVTLPSGSTIGGIIKFSDDYNTSTATGFAVNNLTITPFSGQNIQGSSSLELTVGGQSVELTYNANNRWTITGGVA